MQRGTTLAITLPPMTLTASGRPLLAQGEVEHAALNKDGSTVLTNQRIIWIDTARAPSPGASCYLALHCMEGVEVSATHKWSQNKLRIRLHVDHLGGPISRHSNVSQIREIKIISRHYGNFADRARSLMFQATDFQSQSSSPQAWQNPMMAQQGQHPGHPPASPLAHPSSHQPSQAQAHMLSGWLDAGQAIQQQPSQYVDPALLQQLGGMGFSHNRASRACIATNNTGAQQALHWLFEREGDPSLDGPLAESRRMGGEQGPHADSSPALPGHSHSRPALGFAGISGILKREEQIAARNDRTLEEAFQDLRGLMTKAQEMVQLAEKFRETLAAKGDGSQAESLDPEMQQQLIEIGIASPVTKEVAGASYHKQLSRQLAEFLGPRLSKEGGIMTLADVYCLFNRARGTELISPDDLLQACSLFSKWNAPMYMRQFSTGVTVIASDLHSDEEICHRIATMVAGDGCGPALSATAVSAELKIPLTIATQHLSTAESKGILCRDDGPEGLRFFRNFFEELAC